MSEVVNAADAKTDTHVTSAQTADQTVKADAKPKVERKGSGGITVVAKSALGRRRGGIAFTTAKTYVPHEAISDEQYTAIVNDPELFVFYGKEDDGASVYAVPTDVQKKAIEDGNAVGVIHIDGPATQPMVDAAANGQRLPHPATASRSTTHPNSQANPFPEDKAAGDRAASDRADHGPSDHVAENTVLKGKAAK